MTAENDEGRPGEGRPRKDLLTGEITNIVDQLGVAVPWASVPDEALVPADDDVVPATVLKLPAALEARLVALETAIACPWACGANACPWACGVTS
jgi:hypothetical protein